MLPGPHPPPAALSQLLKPENPYSSGRYVDSSGGYVDIPPCLLRPFPPQRRGRQNSSSRSLSPPRMPIPAPRGAGGAAPCPGACCGARLHPQGHSLWRTTADATPTSLARAMPPLDVPAGSSPWGQGPGALGALRCWRWVLQPRWSNPKVSGACAQLYSFPLS